MTKDNFIKLFVEILNREFDKSPQQDITGFKAIEVIERVFEELNHE